MSSSDVPIYKKSFTESEAVAFITSALAKLKELQESSDFNLIYKVFQNLSQSYFDLKAHLQAMSTEMLKLKYVALTSNFIARFNKEGYFVNDDVWFSTYYALNCLWNYCDGFQDIANEILLTELPQYLISNILHKPYLDGLKSTNIYYLIKSSISIIHNIVRCPGHEAKFKIDELKNVLVDLIRKNDSDFIGLISMLTLACLVNESELHLLEEGKNTIKALIKKIREAFESNSKRVNGFAIWELVNGLRCVSANDNMKKTIVAENGIKLIIDIIKNPTCEDDIEKCLGVLWNLCFDKDIRAVLISDYDLRGILKQFETHKSSKIKKIYDGILWLIDDKAQSKQRLKSAQLSKTRASKDKWKFDVFFSYSWANKALILSIRDILLKSNIKVWIDIDQMKGSTLEAMADGIENSNIFVMAISEAYRTSPNCRTEAEYAFSLKKPIIPLIVELKYRPTSWLGMIMGSKTYYEFSERRNFEESICGLLNNIKTITDNTEQISIDAIVPTAQSGAGNPPIITNATDPKSLPIYSWSNKNVEQWLVKNGLGHIKTKFVNIDGKLLSSLININTKSPNYLYEVLKVEYGMKLIDMLKLNLAINEINA